MLGSTYKIFRRYRSFLRTRNRKYFNGQLLRLYRVAPASGESLCHHSPSDTSPSVGRTSFEMRGRALRVRVSGRQFIRAGNSIHWTHLAGNPLGVNFLLFTAYGRAVMPKRSRRVIVRPNQLSPSFSGDFEYTDAGAGKLKNGVVIREGFEEINLVEEHIVKGEIAFLGLN